MKRILILSILFITNYLQAEFRFCTSLFVEPPFWATSGISKIGLSEIKLYLGIEILNPQDIAVTKLKAKDDPSTVNDDDELTGYVTDAELNLIGFNPTLTSAELYGNKFMQEKFFNPYGLDADEEGNLFIADSGNNRIVVLKNSGTSLNFYNSFYLTGKPFDITHDYKGNLYVTLYDKNMLQVLDKYGTPEYQIKNEIIKKPLGIKLIDKKDKWNYYKSDFIVFVNNDGREIVKLTKHGKIIKRKKFKEKVKLRYIGIDFYSGIYVTDELNNCIHKLDKDLNYICSFKGNEDEKSLYKPRGIDIWKRFGQVYIVERYGGRYYWIGIDVINLKVEKNGMINYFFTDPSFLSIKLYKNNKIVWKKERLKLLKYKGKFALPSKFFKENGRIRIKFRIEPTYSSFSRFMKEKEIRIDVNK